jgi:tRNA-dihydrouridine synthase B
MGDIIERTYIRPLRIGKLTIRHNLVVAPLAGISNYPFRQICREFGADLTFTEMVSVDGLVYESKMSRELLKISPNEHPIGFQLFGSNPDHFQKVLPMLEKMGPDVIDLNFSCPVRKVVSKGAGAAILRDMKRLRQIVQICKSSTTIPLMVKIRTGWDERSIVAVDAAQAAEAAGADAITVHGRTRNQRYSERADWESIARVKEVLKIPVIGNGDVFTCEAALEIFRMTQVDGIMLARGILGKPWLVQEILQFLNGCKMTLEINLKERFKILERHYQYQLSEYPEDVALSHMKKHFVWYTRGLPHTARLRDQIFRSRSYSQIMEVFSTYVDNLLFEKEDFGDKIAVK